MSTDDEPKALGDLLKPGTTLMVGTPSPQGYDFRPLTVAAVDGPVIDVLLDTEEAWVEQMGTQSHVLVTVSDNRTNTWASLHGTGSLSSDATRIDELWSPFASAYFDDGRDSPGIAVLSLAISDGRYWTTTSGRAGALLSALKAKLGRPDDAGEHGEVAV